MVKRVYVPKGTKRGILVSSRYGVQFEIMCSKDIRQENGSKIR